MNVRELINKITEVANAQHVSSVFDGDVYENWNSTEIKFGSVNIGLQDITYTANLCTYNIILYYGDRLMQDNRNVNNIYSDGVRTLQSIINELNNENNINIGELITYTPFQQKFMDYLAGVYCQIDIETDSELGLCSIDDMEDTIDRDYLKFTALEDGSSVGFQQSTLGTQYSYDGHNWENATKTGGEINMFELNSGQTLYVRAMGVIPNFNSAISGNVKVSGNINTINNYKYDDDEPRNYGYQYIFGNCTGLTDASELVLPSQKVGVNSYCRMFSHCTNLVYAPKILPATELNRYCYSEMFEECSSLITAPELPATTLAGFCYDGMFKNCVLLTKAPELPAETLFANAYQYMFSGCQSLNYIKCLATNISMVNCTKEWVNGVAATGTFVKNETMDDWTIGINGIPDGWTIE